MEKIYIPYSSPEEQIVKLRSQNLSIPDEDSAKTALVCFGYSDLIKSYRDPYIVRTDDGITYRSGVTFNQVFSLYLLDKNLRNAVMAAMLDLEETLREAVANVVAQSFGTDPDIYLQYKNYQNKKKSVPRFSLSNILKAMKEALGSGKDPICHYSNKYGIVPPWILFKGIYLSTLVNFVDLFKRAQKEMLIRALYPMDIIDRYSPESIIELMMDTLFVCLAYRNIAAHGGRIYNFECKRHIRFSSNLPYSIKGFSQLLSLLALMKYKAPYMHLCKVLNNELNRHCGDYPQDITYLGQVLNVNITSTNIVWTSDHSNKYHSSPHCSGIKNAKKISLDDAVKKGLIKCKRCFKP